MLETLNFDFCDLLDELFHMNEKYSFEKIKFLKVIFKSHINYDIRDLVTILAN